MSKLSLLVMTGSLAVYAAEQNLTEGHHPIKKLETKIESKLIPGYTAPAKLDMEAIGLTTSASFLYWQPFQDSFDLGMISESSDSVDRKTKNFDFDYKPGFKLGLGMNFNHDGFALYGEYTWLYANETTRAHPHHGFIVPPWLTDGNTGDATHAANHWKFWLNMLDISLLRVSFLGIKMTFTPLVGGRVLWIDQRLRTAYTIDRGAGMVPEFTHAHTMTKSRGWLVGPRIGLNGDWIFGCGIKFVGDFALSLLYGMAHTRHKETDINLPKREAVDVKNTFDGFKLNVDMGVGFGWSSYFNDRKEHVDVLLRYDWLYFQDANYLAQAVGRTGAKNLTVNGVTLTAKFDF